VARERLPYGCVVIDDDTIGFRCGPATIIVLWQTCTRYCSVGLIAVKTKLAEHAGGRRWKKPWYVVPILTRYFNKLRIDANVVFEVLLSRTRS
jgi:hypothetical protein